MSKLYRAMVKVSWRNWVSSQVHRSPPLVSPHPVRHPVHRDYLCATSCAPTSQFSLWQILDRPTEQKHDDDSPNVSSTTSSETKNLKVMVSMPRMYWNILNLNILKQKIWNLLCHSLSFHLNGLKRTKRKQKLSECHSGGESVSVQNITIFNYF